jgi:hypothetical protein
MRKYIFPLIVFFIGFYLIGLRLVGIDFDGIPGDMGDGRLNNYFLEQGYLYISGSIDSYWNAPFFYPTRSTMSMSDNLFGTLPLYALLRTLSFDRETAYQLWFLCILALNFISCMFCLQKLKLPLPAAAIGAYIFAFSLPVAGGLGHIQMLPKFALPLIMYCLIKFIRDKKAIHLFFFLFFSVYQIYCGIYLGFMSAIASIVVIAVMLIGPDFKKEIRILGTFFKTHWLRSLVFFIIHGSLLFLLLRPYVLLSGGLERDYMYAARGLPNLASYFFPTEHSLLYSWLRPLESFLNNSHEHTLFMGAIGIVALSFGIYLFKRKKELRIWFLSFLVLIFLTLNITHFVSLYILVYILPGFQSIRAVSRIVQIELFFLAGLVAVLINHFVYQPSVKFNKNVVIGIIFSLLVVDQFVYKNGLMTFSKKESQQRIAVLRNEVESKNGRSYSCFVYLPADRMKVYKYHVDAMLVSQELNIPTINGYTAFSPKGYQEFFEEPTTENLQLIIDQQGIQEQDILKITGLEYSVQQ